MTKEVSISRYCPKCLKAKRACICQWIQPVHCDTQLIILQHPSEEKRPLGTARILSLSLPNGHLFIGENFSTHQALNDLLADDTYQSVVLYPGEDSVELSQVQLAASNKHLRVILLDGTWKKAFKMWKLSTNLHALPLVKLPETLQGDYRIRKAPSPNALSTVEAGHHIIQTLEPERNFDAMLVAFEKMIEFQIQQMPSGVYEKNYRAPDSNE